MWDSEPATATPAAPLFCLARCAAWKAFCFTDQPEADAYTNGTDSLTPDLIVEIFQKDLEQRGIRSEHPPSLAIDQGWADTIRSVYTAEPFSDELIVCPIHNVGEAIEGYGRKGRADAIDISNPFGG